MDTLPALPTWGVVSFLMCFGTPSRPDPLTDPKPTNRRSWRRSSQVLSSSVLGELAVPGPATGAERADQPRLLASRTTSRRPPGLLARLAKSSRYGNQGRSPSRFGARSDGQVEPPATPRTARRNWPRRRSGPKSGARLWTSRQSTDRARRVTACSLSCSPARRHTPAGSRQSPIRWHGLGLSASVGAISSDSIQKPTQSRSRPYAAPLNAHAGGRARKS